MISHFLNETWEHWQYGTATDAWGGTTTGWTKQDDIEGRMRPLSGDHIIRDNSDTVVMSAKFYIAATESVEVGDQLRNGDTYEITAVVDPMSMGRFKQVEAKKL